MALPIIAFVYVNGQGGAYARFETKTENRDSWDNARPLREKQPQITTQQEAFARQVAARLANVAEVGFSHAAKSREQIEQVVRDFNTQGYDGIMIIMLLYSPGFADRRPAGEPSACHARQHPAHTERPTDWDWARLTTNQGIHGAQDTATCFIMPAYGPRW